MIEHYLLVKHFMEKKNIHVVYICIYSLKLIFLTWNIHFNIRALQKYSVRGSFKH